MAKKDAKDLAIKLHAAAGEMADTLEQVADEMDEAIAAPAGTANPQQQAATTAAWTTAIREISERMRGLGADPDDPVPADPEDDPDDVE